MFLVYYISVTTVGTWATDWANDGVFGDGWHLFGIGASAYEDASGEYGKADQIIEAIQNGETSVDITDDEGNVEETVNITPDVQSEAQATVDAGEPDPADYGVWVPGVPVIIGNALDAVGCFCGHTSCGKQSILPKVPARPVPLAFRQSGH